MASLTIRNLDDMLKRKLRVRAAQNDRSMEDEARNILRSVLSRESGNSENLADAIRARIAPLGGVELELELPGRDETREPPPFE